MGIHRCYHLFNQNILSAIPFAMDIVAEDFTLLCLNEEMHGRVGPDALGRKCYAVLRDDGTPCPNCPWLGPMEPDQRGSLEVDGILGTKSFRITYRLIEVDGERAMLEVFEDITAAKAADKAMQDSLERLRKALEGTVRALATMAEKRDPYTAGHQQRVAQLASAISDKMGLSAKRREAIRIAALLHDISKVYVPAEILNKPGQLTPVEMDLIKTHPQVGKDIVKAIPFDVPVAQIILQHQERLDGSGYPNGLERNAILLEARILAVADVVEAIASHRPYRPALGITTALEEITQNRGTYYDEEVVDACLELFTRDNFRWPADEAIPRP
ncbi:MAG: HD domain-containing phosphohydrolase [Limnochordia bacterium]|jgi:putative nucleotidyltransferase with HDIG domain